MNASNLSREDIAPVLDRYTGCQVFAETLEEIRHGEDMLRTLGRYIAINAPFAGGVANLAGEIAVRRDLFRDPAEPVSAFADRSTRVAAGIFYACVDEFRDRSAPRGDTHRSLAQATLKGISAFYEVPQAALAGLIEPTAGLMADIRRVADGYGVCQQVAEEKLFRAMGFHAGSEILADEEFRLLHAFLMDRHGDLAGYLGSHEFDVGGISHPAYLWIKIHTSVEADHFDFAMRGANDALRYYAGELPAREVKDLILQGLGEFAALQADFMRHLATSD